MAIFFFFFWRYEVLLCSPHWPQSPSSLLPQLTECFGHRHALAAVLLLLWMPSHSWGWLVLHSVSVVRKASSVFPKAPSLSLPVSARHKLIWRPHSFMLLSKERFLLFLVHLHTVMPPFLLLLKGSVEMTRWLRALSAEDLSVVPTPHQAAHKASSGGSDVHFWTRGTCIYYVYMLASTYTELKTKQSSKINGE